MCPLWAVYIFPGSVHIFPPAEKAVLSWEYIIRSPAYECGNWDWDPDIPFLGILASNFGHFFFAVCCHRSSTGLIKYWQKILSQLLTLWNNLLYRHQSTVQCRHLKNWPVKGFCRYFTQLCKLLPLSPSPWFTSPPFPFPVWISILYTRIQCVRGWVWGSGPQKINTAAKSLYMSIFYDVILLCLLRVLPFYEYESDKSFSAKQHSPLKRWPANPLISTNLQTSVYLQENQFNIGLLVNATFWCQVWVPTKCLFSNSTWILDRYVNWSNRFSQSASKQIAHSSLALVKTIGKKEQQLVGSIFKAGVFFPDIGFSCWIINYYDDDTLQ
jgi:hypothetical protein